MSEDISWNSEVGNWKSERLEDRVRFYFFLNQLIQPYQLNQPATLSTQSTIYTPAIPSTLCFTNCALRHEPYAFNPSHSAYKI